MLSLTCFNRRFTTDWPMAIVVFFAILLFLRLGYWQLARAEEKKQLLAAQARAAQQRPLSLSSAETRPQQYQSIKVKGRYLPDILLLDNQHHAHRFGYNVLSPFELSSGKVVLIDRGWVPGDKDREILPEITIPAGTLTVKGYVYYPSEKNWVLGQAYEKKNDQVTLVERIDTQLIGLFLHKSLYPFIIRLNNDEQEGYLREWAIVSMQPERHYAYALQWFALALVILILFISLNLQKNDET